MAHKMETTTSNYINDSTIDVDVGSGGNADCGYSSQGSLTHVSPVSASSHRLSVSHYLQPIYENVPVNSFESSSILTPTSQNIQRITEFHITSPLSSLKRSASSSSFTSSKNVTPKKMRMDGKGRSKTHRNLIDNIHADENSENREIANLEFSPIKSVNVLQERNGKFERKGSFSSTPIYEETSLKSMSVSKTGFFNSTNRADKNSLVIRKTKSFSPSKKSWLVTRNRELSIESAPIPEAIELLCNPVRKTNKRMLSRQNAIETVPDPSTPNSIDISATDFLDSDIKLESPVTHRSPQKPRIPAIKSTLIAKDDVVAIRPLFDLSPLLTQRKSCAHLKHLDIVSNLAETTTALKMIFRHLGPKDIYNMYNVCLKWRTIIKNDAFACSQRNKYRSTLVKNKENLQRKPLLRARSLNPNMKSPFKLCNNISLKKSSPKQEPSLENFLMPIMKNQRRTGCPNCGRPSIISKNVEPNSYNENRIPFRRSNFHKDEIFRNWLKSTSSHYEFADCTKCGFKFCMNCKRKFHGSDQCPTKTFVAPMDSEDEEDDLKVPHENATRRKRSLRRLASLDKVKFSSIE